MGVESPPFVQAGTFGAEQFRRHTMFMLQRGSSIGSVTGGIVNATDCQLSAPGSGLSVSVAPGELVCPGSSSSTQSGYYARVSSTTSLTIATANGTNPRVDLVCATVADAAYTGSSNSFTVQVLTGTPTSGATLSNLSGAPSLPTSSLALGYVLVPTSATNIVSADILNVAGIAKPSTGLAYPTTYTISGPSLSTVYQPSATRPSFVTVSVNFQTTSTSGSEAFLGVNIGPTTSTAQILAGGLTSVSGNVTIPFAFPLPPGWYWEMLPYAVNGGTVSVAICATTIL